MADQNSSPVDKVLDEKTGVSRRNLFHILGAAPVAAAVAQAGFAQVAPEQGQHSHTGLNEQGQDKGNKDHVGMDHGDQVSSKGAKGPYKRRTFDDQQWRTVSVLSNLIIPADERSGNATDAGVPEFMDDWIAFRKSETGHAELESQILGGLTWLDREAMTATGKRFADAPVATQKSILDRVAWPDKATKEDLPWVTFFGEFRDLTVSGFFSSKMGVKDLRYMGNTAVAEWKGCPPEVWAIIEDRMKHGYKGVTTIEVKPWGA